MGRKKRTNVVARATWVGAGEEGGGVGYVESVGHADADGWCTKSVGCYKAEVGGGR